MFSTILSCDNLQHNGNTARKAFSTFFKAQDAELLGNDTENDDEDYKAIFEGLELGTEATRTGIIDNARKSEYILLIK